MGFNTKTGVFAGLTNLRRWNAPKSRGKVVYETLQNQNPKNIDKSPVSLEYLNDYAGFNLCWSNMYDPKPSLYYISNVGRITKPICVPEGVVGVGNDRLHDEFVKVPYLEQQMRKAIEEHVTKFGDGTTSESLNDLLDKLGSILTDQTAYKHINKDYISKFFFFGGHRLIQPGLQTFLYGSLVGSFVSLLSLLALNFTGISFFRFGFGSYALALLIPMLLALLVGFYHHHILQNIFVTIPVPLNKTKNWKTVSQTIAFATKEGAVHYFFRNTLEAWKPADARKISWKHFVVSPDRVVSQAL